MLLAYSPLKMDYLSTRNGQQYLRNRTYRPSLLLKLIPKSLRPTLEKNKTRKIISSRYYQPGIVIDINRYIRNYNNCYKFIISQDKTLGLLKLLLILERPQQYISIDFYKLPILAFYQGANIEGYDLSKIGRSQCCLSVGQLVCQLVTISQN